MHDLICITTLWAVWCCIHSLLISQRIKDAVAEKFPQAGSFYRLAYTIFSTVTLIPLVVYTVLIPQTVLFSYHGLFRIVQVFLAIYSLVLFLGGMFAYDMQYFLGLRQLRNRNRKEDEKQEFQQQGILKVVRHPWYSGGIALLWCSSPVTDVGLSIRLLLSLYFVVGARLEERRLMDQFGESYQRYRQQVPMLIPNFSAILHRRGR